MNSLNDFINSIEVVDRQEFKNLSLCFVRGRQMRDLRIRNYDETIEDRTLLITEVDDGGNVPELRFNNKGNMPVFIPEGTIIMGLKQSRTVRVSFVINQYEELLVPVHCVEQSRWAFNTKEGNKAPFHLYARLRASNIKHTSESLREGRGFNSRGSQGDTWRNISRRMERMNIQSDTGFAGDIFENSKEDIDQYIQAFKCPDTATGFLAMINGHVIAMDVFASEGLLQRNFQPLLSGVALEAMDTEFNREIQKHKVLTVEQFLRLIENSKKETFKSVGHGEDIRFESNGIVGSALVTDNKVIHVEAFTEVV